VTQEFEHGGAGVHDVGLEVRVLREELSEETTVSVAEDEGSPLLEESGKIVEAAAFEGSAESEVFEPAIGAGYEVKVGLSGSGQRHAGFARWRAMRSKAGCEIFTGTC
jgi:hypothetical protein